MGDEKKLREWFAVKRAEGSVYQFYEPNPRNRKTIEAIAPDGGNFEVTVLIEKSAYDALAAENEKLKRENCTMREALSVYADFETWNRGWDGKTPPETMAINALKLIGNWSK